MRDVESALGKNITDFSLWPCSVREHFIKQQPVTKFMNKFVRITTIFNSITGTILNFINVIILAKLIPKSSYYIHLTALAIGDFGNCLFNFGQGLLRVYIKEFDEIFVKYKGFCIFHSMCIDFFCLIPVWMVCIITAQKLVSLTWPLKSVSWITRTTVKRIVIIAHAITLV